jgi:hypothetical protein
MKITDPTKQNIALNCVTLSFYDNKISNLEKVGEAIEPLFNLKALWLNENPVSEDQE